MGLRVLVTGAGGFVGGAIARELIERGHSVRSFSRGEHAELAELGITPFRGDLADSAAVDAAAQGCDAVVHAAAKAGVWGPREEYERTNVLGTHNVVSACRRAGVGRLVFTSSPSVVFDGNHQHGIAEGSGYPSRFLAHYPRTKAAAERIVLEADGPGLATVALRPHLVWGPGDPHLVPRVIERARSGRLRILCRRGQPSGLVDSTFVDNAANAHVLALEKLNERSPLRGRAYFISNGEPIEMADLLGRILAAAGLPPVAQRFSPLAAYAAGAVLEAAFALLGWSTEPPMTRFVARQLSTAHWFDISAARRDLGYEPRVRLEEGFERLRRWLEQAPSRCAAAM